MSENSNVVDPLKAIDDLLSNQLSRPERAGDFDMNDQPEAEVLDAFPELKGALEWLEVNLGERWRKADREALRCQRHHRRLARAAIVSGTAAIVLAIVQLSIKLTWPQLSVVALVLEGLAVLAALIAVVAGLWFRLNHRWIGQRHLAERFRMLKFRALEQLWCHDQESWRDWVEKQLASLKNAEKHEDIEKWATEDSGEPTLVESLKCAPDRDALRALTSYYLSKRVGFQAAYFTRRRQDFKKKTGPWQRLSLPFFVAGVVFAIVHFGLELFASPAEAEHASTLVEHFAVWCVALAAIIPVVGLGIRAWFAAFELPRSANLYAAKHRALTLLKERLDQDAGRALPTVHHLAWAESFLEQEHREWLRLLLETEWFL